MFLFCFVLFCFVLFCFFQLTVVRGAKEEMSFENNLSDGEESGHGGSQIQYFLIPVLSESPQISTQAIASRETQTRESVVKNHGVKKQPWI